MTSPQAKELAKWVRVRVRVLLLIESALDAAKQITAQGKLVDRADELPREVISKPRPVMILPPSHRLQRMVMRGIVHRRS